MHDHAHGPVSGLDGARVNRAFLWGIALNLLFVAAEFIAGFITHSLALMADAGHNLSDVASLALSLLAFRLAKITSNPGIPMDTAKVQYLSPSLTPCCY